MKITIGYLLGSARKTFLLAFILAQVIAFFVSGPALANQYLRYSTDNIYQVPSKLDLSDLKVNQTRVLSTDNSNAIQITDDTSSNIKQPKIHCNDSNPPMSAGRIASGNPDYRFELYYNATRIDCRVGASPFYRSYSQGNQNMVFTPMKLVLVKVGDSGSTASLRYPDFQMCKREGSTPDSDRACWRGERNGLSRYYPSWRSPVGITVKPILNDVSLTKSFSPSTINAGEISILSFTIAENVKNDGQDNKFSFTDTLRDGLVVATPANIKSTCTGGTIAADAGGSTISVTDATLSNGTPSCTISVAVTAAEVGSYVNGAADLGGLDGIETDSTTDQTLTVNDPCTPGEPIPGAFRVIRIGDRDGFGFGEGEGLTAAYGKPVNKDGEGLLSVGDFLPDVNGDGKISNRDGGDSFDNRSDAEVAGTFLTGSGFIDTGSKGSDYTDLALATSFGKADSPTAGRPFPDGSSKKPNQPSFKFDFKVSKDKLPEGTPLYLNVMLGDFDVEPGQVTLTSTDGTQVTQPLELSAKGKKDGVIQAAATSLDFDRVFSDGDANGAAGYWLGSLTVDVDGPDEPFWAFDFAEIGTTKIPLTQCPAS